MNATEAHVCSPPGAVRRFFFRVPHGALWTCKTCGRVFCLAWTLNSTRRGSVAIREAWIVWRPKDESTLPFETAISHSGPYSSTPAGPTCDPGVTAATEAPSDTVTRGGQSYAVASSFVIPGVTHDEEEMIEAAFWEFDAERKRTGAERDAFKGWMRHALRAGKRAGL